MSAAGRAAAAAGALIDRGGQGSSLSGWLRCLLEQKGCVLSRRTVAQVPGGAGHPRHGGRREQQHKLF